MNALLKSKIETMDHRHDVLRAVLSHFGKNADSKVSEKIAASVDDAYVDDLLFEEFEIWMDEHNDEALLYQIEHFQKAKHKRPLSSPDLTGQKDEQEKIQKEAEQDLAHTFAARLRTLADQRGLKTNKEVGDFLDRTAEQVRVIFVAEHKPQRKTLLLVAEKFQVPVDVLIE